MVTVLNSVGKRFFVFSKVSATSANPLPLRVLEPLKIRSSRLSERSVLILCSPITQRMASTIFDLPQPFGPTIPVIWLSRLMTVRSAKLLNPLISNDFSRTFLLFWRRENTATESNERICEYLKNGRGKHAINCG